MTASQPQQTMPIKDAAAIRKRRRRAPAGGAADDCFTCTKRNVKCDRRRPYCSQCLEVGNECSGYKTQLTWNVGVASRGKLRGLSLPIAKAPPVPREVKKQQARARAHTTTTTTAPPQPRQWREPPSPSTTASRSPIDIPSMVAASAPATPYGATGFDYLQIPQSDHHHNMSQHHWGGVSPYSGGGMLHSPEVSSKFSRFPFPLITENLSSSVGSIGSTASDIDYLSPISQTYSREEMPFIHSPNVLYDGFSAHHESHMSHSPPSGPLVDYNHAPTACSGLIYAPSEAGSSLPSHFDVFESHLSQKLMREADQFSAPEPTDTLWPSQAHRPSFTKEMRNAKPGLASPISTSPQSSWSSATAEQPPLPIAQDVRAKMPFFMDYYRNTLCPSMVFVDGPENPFRDNIMQLARDSQSLQHAICALSACNLRMRRKMSLGQDTSELYEILVAEKQAADNAGDSNHIDPAMAEEYQHRNLAVNLLNQQLNDASTSGHDSVLATILLLCHYRMVESGIARFQTQFAGVKKILALRRSQSFNISSEPSWLESMFTYFDAISASINDREAQLVSPGTPAELPILHAGVENLVGCDRDLFKTISKLGRLNLLSQRRPVQSPATTPDIHNRFDGNGFGTKLNEEELMMTAMDDSHQSTFWREWKDARFALQQWQFNALKTAARLPAAATAAQIRDLGSLSESFRYAALLYTERLVSPSLPSSHSNMQNLVSQVVYYATSLETGSRADKFLLWPLFIAGSECVNELQQNIVRSKVRDIMSRSGYMNNLAALDALERIWSGKGDSSFVLNPDLPSSPFKWNTFIGEAGSDVEWLMF